MSIACAAMGSERRLKIAGGVNENFSESYCFFFCGQYTTLN
jgi:hypothetical protein